ncbi:flagellar M-ring protein FliF [Anaerosporomusa subterranea]|uniref:Flagellar M-ring protein n=1 Tax=Anaerosporomusa subterranea TaxID=1794912 RepID=A0A154BTR7_ANASB|nr:flagellar basal-body MS-ring/collar protein FliF [Anaerosporomusa subterranea]KYZ77297.1 flagellar M-ring protein FliF [Anaerosporomusa subterranea]
MVDWKEQSLRLWQTIDKRQRYILGGVALLLFLSILGWSYWWGGRPEYVPLFTNMEAKDAGEVAAKLKEMKVPYEIGNNGTAIMAHSNDVYRIRLELASIGLPRGNKGFEIFDQNKFGVTEFQNKVYLLQALQGELSRTIEQLAEVEKARVHIVMPEDSLYRKNEKPATASIMLKLRPNSQLSKEQVRGIVNLVAHSIQGLKAENITVVDNFARVLNEEEPNSQQQFDTKANLTFIELTKKVQDGLQKSAQSMLEQVLGPGKAAVRVNVELNFDQRIVDKQTFQPVVDDKGIVRSMQESTEAYKGTTGALGGTPGVATNIPGYVTNNNNTQSNYDKKEVTRNYEVNETKEKVVAAPGSIKRLTVSVLVDANVGGSQQESIAKVVSSAVGLNPARGDAIAVEIIPFNTEATDRLKQELSSEQQSKQNMYIILGIAAVVLLLAYFIARLVIRRRKENEVQIVTSLEETASAVELQEPVVQPMSPEEQERIQQRETVERFAKAKPEEVAQLVRAWLGDE